jgi:hypothetical protein
MEAVLQAVNEGEAYRFILKPWNDMDLKASINIALAHHKLVQDNRRLMDELSAKSQLLELFRRKHPELFEEVAPDQGYEIQLEQNDSAAMTAPQEGR